jgi:hypothetical protein
MFEQLKSRLKALGEVIIGIIKKVFIQRGKDATGKTLSSLRQETLFDVNSVAELNVYGSKAFDYIEQGRPAGSKLPPQGVLIDWMQARGIPLDKEFAIRKSIAENGIAPVPIIEFSFIQVQRVIQQDLSEKILDDLTKTISTLIKKGFEFRN